MLTPCSTGRAPTVSDRPYQIDRISGVSPSPLRITYGGPYGTNSFVVTAFLPKARRPAPAFLLINNRHPDMKMADPERVAKEEFWPAEEIVSRGYAARRQRSSESIHNLCLSPAPYNLSTIGSKSHD